MNSFPRLTYVYDRYKKATSKRKASIELRITYNYKQKYISTGIEVLPKQWKNGSIVNHAEAEHLNIELNRFLIEVRQIIIDMESSNNINIFSIPKILEKKKNGITTFLDFCKERAKIRKYGKSDDTIQRYDRFIRLFNEYGKITDFSDITEASILTYDNYLNSRGMKPYSKWNNYHRFLNSFIIDAIDAGFLKKNPYKWVNIEKDKDINGYKRCLTPEEFQRIKRVDLSTESLQHVRDVFVFQTYTCLSYADLKNFNIHSIHDVKGMKVYIGKREKTEIEFTVPLIKPALEILMKYNNKLPVISNVKYNEYLKVVAQAAHIDKPVSSHWARHTGATILLNRGIPMQIVAKICGHSSTKITEQVYAKLLDETVVDAIKEVKI